MYVKTTKGGERDIRFKVECRQNRSDRVVEKKPIYREVNKKNERVQRKQKDGV